jgi:hypothetical protein
VCGQYIRKQCIAPLRQMQLASSTRGPTESAWASVRACAHGLHVHRGESVSHTLVDPRQLASDARMPTIYVSVGLLHVRRRHLGGLRVLPGRDQPRPQKARRSLEVRASGFVRLISYVSMPAAWCRFRVCLLHAAAPVVCCILCVASAVLRTGCRVQCIAHAAGCALPAARRTRNAAVLCVSCCISHVLASPCMSSAVCCTLSVACVVWFCRLLRGVCCMPRVACCLVACCQWSFPKFLLHAARCPLHAACCMLRCTTVLSAAMLLEVWRMLPVARGMFAGRCIVPAACRMLSGSCPLEAACRWLHFPRRMLHVVRHIFRDAGCMLSIVCCTISSGRLRHAVRWIVSTCPFFVAYRTFSVACGLLPVARPSVPCRMVCAVCRLVPRRISSVACYALRVVCCMLHTALSVLPVVSCPVLHVVCRMLPVACCRVAQRRHTRSASRRRIAI